MKILSNSKNMKCTILVGMNEITILAQKGHSMQKIDMFCLASCTDKMDHFCVLCN